MDASSPTSSTSAAAASSSIACCGGAGDAPDPWAVIGVMPLGHGKAGGGGMPLLSLLLEHHTTAEQCIMPFALPLYLINVTASTLTFQNERGTQFTLTCAEVQFGRAAALQQPLNGRELVYARTAAGVRTSFQQHAHKHKTRRRGRRGGGGIRCCSRCSRCSRCQSS